MSTRKVTPTKVLTLVGTCHVFNIKQRIKNLIIKLKPPAVCVELDKKRFDRLTTRATPMQLAALVQDLIALYYGARAGDDMYGAIEGARQIKARLFLIDKDIESTEQALRQAVAQEFLSPLELVRKLIAYKVFASEFPFQDRQPGGLSIPALVDDFEKNPERYRTTLRRLFPYFKRALMDDRERHMAQEIRKIAETYDHILAVVGAGHVTGLVDLLPDFTIRRVTLRDLQTVKRET
jgi:pheromone shutdown protein TraB